MSHHFVVDDLGALQNYCNRRAQFNELDFDAIMGNTTQIP